MPKSQSGRGSSHSGKRKKKSSTSSNRVHTQSPPSVTRQPGPRSHASEDPNPPPPPPSRPQNMLQPLVPTQHTPSASLQSNHSNRLHPQIEEDEFDDTTSESSEEGEREVEVEAEGGIEDYNNADEVEYEPDQGVADTSLVALLTAPGRDEHLERLSPQPGPRVLWFDRDDTVLVNVISTIIQDKFDGPWYSWRRTPKHVQDGFFVRLAHQYTWEPIITPLVRREFEKIAKRRLKGMVSYVRKHRNEKKPNWIRTKLWERMVKYFDSQVARKRSKTASDARNSDRGGLGPHKHVSGPKSHQRIHREMEIEEGRPVSVGEVFIKTHTKKDGTIVDQKAKKVKDVYSDKLEATLSQLEPSSASDGASQAPQLTVEQKDALFFESTSLDGRGNPYGIGRLAERFRKGKKAASLQIESRDIVELKSQLEDANQKIQEQAKYNLVLFKYLKEKDPDLPGWMEPQSSATNPTTTVPEPEGSIPLSHASTSTPV